MIVSVDEKFLNICKKIINENLCEKDWTEIESDDQFCDFPYCGGFDAIENAFCFGYDIGDGRDYSIQLTLKEIKDVLDGKITQLNAVDLKKLDDSRRK